MHSSKIPVFKYAPFHHSAKRRLEDDIENMASMLRFGKNVKQRHTFTVAVTKNQLDVTGTIISLAPLLVNAISNKQPLCIALLNNCYILLVIEKLPGL